MKKWFGTDGVRGIANVDLTPELAFEFGRICTVVLSEQTLHSPTFIIGKDTRLSGDLMEAALTAGILSMGGHVLSVGVFPTPGIAWMTRNYEADAGVVISASHNPYEFNGIKIFNAKGYKLSDELEERIETLLFQKSDRHLPAVADKIGKKTAITTGMNDYIHYLKDTVKVDFTDMKILLDCANGAAYEIAPQLFEQMGAHVTLMAHRPDGININKGCGATDVRSLKKEVKKNGYDLGIALDGDADRLMAIDENGETVDGDRVLAILGVSMKERRSLIDDTIVATVMSNLGLFKMAEQHGLHVVKTKVGDRYVLQEMIDHGFVLGGEQSGHTILLKHATTGDGLLTALHILEIMSDTSSSLSQLASVMTVYPQVLVNAKVANEQKNHFMEDPVIQKMCTQLEKDFQGEGRVLIRASGTEPLVRVMIEGLDHSYITNRAEELVRLIEGRLN